MTPEGIEPKRKADGSRIRALEIMSFGAQAAGLFYRIGRTFDFGAA
jgi:hypothetical protein